MKHPQTNLPLLVYPAETLAGIRHFYMQIVDNVIILVKCSSSKNKPSATDVSLNKTVWCW